MKYEYENELILKLKASRGKNHSVRGLKLWTVNCAEKRLKSYKIP